MIIAVVGSRNFNDYSILCQVMNMFPAAEIVSGAARGADELAARYARENNIKLTEFPAKWDDLTHPQAIIKTNSWGKQYDANAGFRRNVDIVNHADTVIAFWDGKSPGTKNTITLALNAKKDVFVFDFKGVKHHAFD